eukprot:m.64732 g.64732  ORF g.64732 m.64732 type:complete len:453 (+) comp11670_c0_seq2:204-1562(+)
MLSKLVEKVEWPFLTVLFAVYFAQGFRSFSSLAMQHFFKSHLELGPAEIQAWLSLAAIPWSIKPLYGIASDCLPIRGQHRKPYLIIGGILAVAAWLLLYREAGVSALPLCNSTTTESDIPCENESARRLRTITVVVIITCMNIAMALSDVVVDAMVAKKSKGDESIDASLQSFSWGSMAIGGLAGSSLGGFFFESLGIPGMFFFSLIPSLVAGICSLLLSDEKNEKELPGFLTQLSNLRNIFCQSKLLKPALFRFASIAIAPSFGQLTYFYVTEELNISNEFLSLGTFVMWIVMLIGSVLSERTFSGKEGFIRAFVLGQVGVALANLSSIILILRWNTYVGIPDRAFILASDGLDTLIFRISLGPFLLLASQLSEDNMEGTTFASFMSVNNLASQVSGLSGAYVGSALGIQRGQYENLWLAQVLRCVLLLIPVAFASYLLPDRIETKSKKED